jgi:hypothetical protein
MRATMAGLLGLILLAGCAADEEQESAIQTDSDIERNLDVDPLVDVNATSATHDQEIVPSDYQGHVSVWYFGHSN